jgi:predicted Zn-dependent protease
VANRFLRLSLFSAWLALGAACSRAAPDELLADARTALAAGEVRTAEIHLKNLLQSEPDNVPARLMLGEVALASGDLAGAEQNLLRAVALGADSARVQLPLVRALVGQRKFEEALAQTAEGPELEGSARVEALSLEAAAQQGLGRREQAEAAYRAALRLDPGSAQVRSELAALLIDSQRMDAGRTLVDEVLADHPEFVPALLLRANVESTTGRPASAETTLARVIELERAKPEQGVTYAVALSRLAEMQLRLGNADAAMVTADSLLAFVPQSPVARYVKAAVEVQQSDLDAAERRLESLIVDAPSYWPAYSLHGSINVTQNQSGQPRM